MSWSYTPGSGTAKDRVRFFSGDVSSASQKVSDEEISDMLGFFGGNILRAAAATCTNIAARLSTRADAAIDDMRKNLSQQSAQFAARAKELNAQADAGGTTGTIVPLPWAGGVTVADREEREADTTLIQPFFTRDLMDPLATNLPSDELE